MNNSERTLAWHLNSDGLSSVLIRDLLKMCNISKQFVGIYPCTNLKHLKPSELETCIMIVNVGLHFVTMHWTRHYILYIDPFGFGISNDSVKACVKKNAFGRPIYSSKSRLQHLTSSHCGLFATFFALYFDNHTKNIHLEKFIDSASLKNDDICVRNIKRLGKINVIS